MLSAFQLLAKLLKELSKLFLDHATLILVSAEVLQAIQEQKVITNVQKCCLGEVIFFSCL